MPGFVLNPHAAEVTEVATEEQSDPESEGRREYWKALSGFDDVVDEGSIERIVGDVEPIGTGRKRHVPKPKQLSEDEMSPVSPNAMSSGYRSFVLIQRQEELREYRLQQARLAMFRSSVPKGGPPSLRRQAEEEVNNPSAQNEVRLPLSDTILALTC